MRTVPAYQILAEDIKALGVDTVYGLMSDDICQLFATLDLECVDHILHWQANALTVAVGPIVGVCGKNVQGDRPAIRIHLNTHDHDVGAVAAIESGVDAVNIDELDCKIEFVASISATHHAHQKFAIAGQTAHHRFAHVAKMLMAGQIGHKLPFAPGRLDCQIGEVCKGWRFVCSLL